MFSTASPLSAGRVRVRSGFREASDNEPVLACTPCRMRPSLNTYSMARTASTARPAHAANKIPRNQAPKHLGFADGIESPLRPALQSYLIVIRRVGKSSRKRGCGTVRGLTLRTPQQPGANGPRNL